MAEIINIKTGKAETPGHAPAPAGEASTRREWPAEMDHRTAAAYCKMAPKTLHNLIGAELGPQVTKRGWRLWYKRTDLDSWLKHRERVRRAFT